MLSPFRVARLIQSEEFDRLLNEVLMNGRPVSLAVRLRLSDPRSLAPCAMGMALRRLTELTWKPEPPAFELAHRLIGLQGADGSFGSLAGTACAVGALLALKSQCRHPVGLSEAAGGHSNDPDISEPSGEVGPEFWSALGAAIERGLASVAGEGPHLWGVLLQPAGGHVGVAVRARCSDLSAAVDATILLWQLAPHRASLSSAGIPDPSALIDALGLRHHRETANLVEPLLSRDTPARPVRARRAA